MRKRWVEVGIGIFQGLDRGRRHIGGDIRGHPRLWCADIAAEAGEIEADPLFLIAGDTHWLKLIYGFDIYGLFPYVNVFGLYVSFMYKDLLFYSNKAHMCLLIHLQFIQAMCTCLILENCWFLSTVYWMDLLRCSKRILGFRSDNIGLRCPGIDD